MTLQEWMDEDPSRTTTWVAANLANPVSQATVSRAATGATEPGFQFLADVEKLTDGRVTPADFVRAKVA